MGDRSPDQAPSRHHVKICQKRSHLLLGSDFWSHHTQYQSAFQAYWGDGRCQRAPPPTPSDTLHSESPNVWQSCSETMAEYQARPLDCRGPIHPSAREGMIPADPDATRPVPGTSTSYWWHENIQPHEKIVLTKWQTQFIIGNDYVIPAKTNHHRRVLERLFNIKDPGKTKDKLPVLSRNETKPIVVGEPQCFPQVSFTPKPPEGPRPNMTKRRLRDAECQEDLLTSTTASSYTWKATERRKGCTREAVVPSLLHRDTQTQKDLTTATTSRYNKPTKKCMRRILCNPQEEEPMRVAVPGQRVFGSTSYKAQFQPGPAGRQRAEPAKCDIYKNTFNTPGPATTTTQDLFAGRKLGGSKVPTRESPKIKTLHSNLTKRMNYDGCQRRELPDLWAQNMPTHPVEQPKSSSSRKQCWKNEGPAPRR